MSHVALVPVRVVKMDMTNIMGSMKYGLTAITKWFLSDAKYNSHFEKNGIPLSGLEVREEYLKNKAADIVRVKGPARMLLNLMKNINGARKNLRDGLHGLNGINTTPGTLAGRTTELSLSCTRMNISKLTMDMGRQTSLGIQYSLYEPRVRP
jgi:hypothetical protein